MAEPAPNQAPGESGAETPDLDERLALAKARVALLRQEGQNVDDLVERLDRASVFNAMGQRHKAARIIDQSLFLINMLQPKSAASRRPAAAPLPNPSPAPAPAPAPPPPPPAGTTQPLDTKAPADLAAVQSALFAEMRQSLQELARRLDGRIQQAVEKMLQERLAGIEQALDELRRQSPPAADSPSPDPVEGSEVFTRDQAKKLIEQEFKAIRQYLSSDWLPQAIKEIQDR